MDKVIEGTHIGFTTYDNNCSFDMADHIINWNRNSISLGTFQEIFDKTQMYGGLNDFGKRMYWHIDYKNAMNTKKYNRETGKCDIQEYTYPEYPKHLCFYIRGEEQEQIRKEHIAWLNKNNTPVERTKEEKDKLFKDTLKDMTMGVIDLDKEINK